MLKETVFLLLLAEGREGTQPRGCGIGDVIALFFKYSESFGIKDFEGSQYPGMTEIRTAVVK